MTSLLFQRDSLASFDAITQREWLVTNGLGGYASSTLGGCNTRRYHGLLVAALRPPVERTVMIAKLDAVARYRDQSFTLGANEYADGTIDSQAQLHLHSFRLDGSLPIWTWSLDDALIEQRVWMAHGANTTYVSYTLLRASAAVELELAPLCTYRDYHALIRGERNFFVSREDRSIKIDAHWGAHPYRIHVENAELEIAPAWHWNFKHRIESERGLDDVEDLFRPALIRSRLNVRETATVVLSAEASEPMLSNASLPAEQARQQAILETAAGNDPLAHPLTLAADQYIVERRDASGKALGKTIIAGYPWFSDWGRDTMIALPGLTLATGRYVDAASILRTFARFVSDGMLPNRFPDAGETPEYNTVDATLWYFVAIDEYFRATNDRALLKELYPVLREIVDWHLRGTRFGIRADDDGLLRAGEPGVQLTWMDAKIGDWVVTPRIGKPVEINALWFNALVIMKDIAQLLRDRDGVRGYAALSERVRDSFNRRFWFAGGYLFDVIDSPDGDDPSLRPNQLFAISLRHALLDGDKARAVVDVCARELWTPVGMRSLARFGSDPFPNPSPWGRSDEVRERVRNPHYAARYLGGPRERDAVYHQGTVWSWLLGPFVSAHYRVYRNADLALSFLDGIAAHLRDSCIGQVSEIFDGDAPFSPRGCFAQAWGVAEVLRVWREINERESEAAGADRRRA
jgi:predicted glycogen debranching enzyme